MFDEVDDALKRLLEEEMDIDSSEIDIRFEQPKREWSARLNRPTVNLFLYDVRENVKRRTQSPAWLETGGGGNSITQTHQPIWMDLHYMITAWTKDPQDEHRLLSNVIMAFLRHPYLPENVQEGELAENPMEKPIKVAQYDALQNMDKLWAAMDNEYHATVDCTLSLALDPFEEITTPVVKTIDVSTGQSFTPGSGLFEDQGDSLRSWSVAGTVHSGESLEDIRLILLERGQYIPIDPAGRFFITNLREGEYTLDVLVEGRAAEQHILTVPSDDYDIEV
ncbi:MAG TPA: DUF4255 domain-containing protein [Chloroflexi bacterium]|nr:DUF4255 domain-containing protein [Chloroflexota bacterium]